MTPSTAQSPFDPPAAARNVPLRCTRCGFRLRPSVAACWMCRTPVDADTPPWHEFATAPLPPNAFGLWSIFELTTLVAVGCGLATASVPAGVIYGLLVLPAYFRSAAIVRIEQQRGRHVPGGERFGWLLISIFLSLIIGSIAAVVAMLCFNPLFFPGFEEAMVIIGILGWIVTAAGLYYLTWPRPTRGSSKAGNANVDERTDHSPR